MSVTLDLPAMIKEITGDLAGLFEAMEWAEDEIRRAQQEHPAHADALWHSFRVIRPTDGMLTLAEFVSRSHMREILARVVAGEDTRPGTSAEICVALSEVTARTPVHAAAVGLYARAWGKAFPGHGGHWDDARDHYESLYGSQIDDMEAEMRRKLASPERQIGQPNCRGQHNGNPAEGCQFHAASPADKAA